MITKEDRWRTVIAKPIKFTLASLALHHTQTCSRCVCKLAAANSCAYIHLLFGANEHRLLNHSWGQICTNKIKLNSVPTPIFAHRMFISCSVQVNMSLLLLCVNPELYVVHVPPATALQPNAFVILWTHYHCYHYEFISNTLYLKPHCSSVTLNSHKTAGNLSARVTPSLCRGKSNAVTAWHLQYVVQYSSD